MRNNQSTTTQATRILLGGRLALLALGLLFSFSGTQAHAADSREPARAGQSCRLITGYGTTIGYGSTKSEAEANAREICGEKIIDQYYAQRGSIPDSVVGDLSTACINLTCQ